MILFLIGLAAGIVSGMGIGGGAILIPALVIFARPEQHMVQAVNLIYFIPTAAAALIMHMKNNIIDFKTALPIIISGLFGAGLGSLLAASIEGQTLRKYFGIFLLVMGCYEMVRRGNTRRNYVNARE